MNPIRQLATLIVLLSLAAGVHAAAATNTLTAAEKAAGWRLLFDGRTFTGWRGLKLAGPPAQGWIIRDGALTCIADGNGGNLITEETFDNFEFSWEWSMPPKSNNGVKYFIIKERGAIGHEYQLVDDSLVKEPESALASFYLVVAPNPAKKKIRPWGEWNHSRIVVQGNHVEHWLNSAKVLEYECGSAAVLEQVARTKFKKTPNFGYKVRGPLLLTYHKDEASFRNLKVRRLPAQ